MSFRSRGRKLTAADIDRARTEERSLLRTWLMRKTVHMIPADDAAWMLPIFEPAHEKWSRRRLEQLGMPRQEQDKAMREVGRILDREGPMTRNAVREGLRSTGIDFDQQAGLHLIGLATVTGIAIQGPDIGASPSLIRREDWLGRLPSIERGEALAELARRYLRAFGPATERDFAYWAGLPLRDVRAGLEAISGEIAEAPAGSEVLLSLDAARPRLPRAGQIRLLGDFDTYMLGYKSRDFAVASEHERVIKEGGGGWIRPVIVCDGKVIGGWRSKRTGDRIEVSIELFVGLQPAERQAIKAEVEDLGRFEGATVTLIQASA